MQTTLKLTIAITLLLALVQGQTDDTCWQRCFANVPSSRQFYFNRFRELVTRTKNLQETLGSAGLAISMDSASSSDSIFRYERNIASLLALTMNTDAVFNPLCMSLYYATGATYSGSWQCSRDRCTAAAILARSVSSRHVSGSARSVASGQLLAKYCMDRASCRSQFNSDPKLRMTVLIANAGFRGNANYAPLQGEKVVIGVDRASSSQIASLATSGMKFPWMGTMSSSSAQSALRSLLSCVNRGCCRGSSSFPAKRDVPEEDDDMVGAIDNDGKPKLE